LQVADMIAGIGFMQNSCHKEPNQNHSQETQMRLADKVCVITGAGSGMGRVAAQLFASEGACVVVAEVNVAAGEETARLIQDAGGEAIFVATDVSRPGDCQQAIQAAVETYGKLNVLYNNAGILHEQDASVVDTPVDVWDRVLAVNLRGVYLCCKYGIPELIRTGGGSIINIASTAALLGCSVPQDAYTASKGGIIALTRSLAVQYGPQGIRANAICPGAIETPMLGGLLDDPEARAIRLARYPSGRFGQPEDVAYLALYLASDESAWTNGAVVTVDGAVTVNYF